MTKPLILAFGVASILLSAIYAMRMQLYDADAPRLRLGMLCYVPWLVKEIIASSLRVSLLMWRPSKISPKTAWIECGLSNDVSRSIYANSITLTPGTVCMGVKKDKMHIHALEASSIAELKAGDMEQRVARSIG